jgi:hypothetical protein
LILNCHPNLMFRVTEALAKHKAASTVYFSRSSDQVLHL